MKNPFCWEVSFVCLVAALAIGHEFVTDVRDGLHVLLLRGIPCLDSYIGKLLGITLPFRVFHPCRVGTPRSRHCDHGSCGGKLDGVMMNLFPRLVCFRRLLRSGCIPNAVTGM